MRAVRAGRALLAALLAALGVAASPALAQHAGDAVRVNGVGISNERVDRAVSEYLARKGRNAQGIRHPDAYRQYRREAIEELVDEELLWQEAVRLGLVARPREVDAAVAEARSRTPDPGEFERRLARSGLDEATFPEFVRRQLTVRALVEGRIWKGLRVTDREVKEYWATHPEEFQAREEVRARHVLVPVDLTAPAADRDRARAEAESIRTALLAGADFAATARERSGDGSAAQGGDLGWFARGKMVPEFEGAAFALPEGQLSPVVETAFGFHVIRVEGRRGGGTVPLAEARDALREKLLAARRKAAIEETLARLRDKARIVYASPP